MKLFPQILHSPWSGGRICLEIATVAGYHSQALVLAMALFWPLFVFFVQPPSLFVVTQVLLAPLAWAAPLAFFLAHRARGKAPLGQQIKDVAAAIGLSQGLSIAVTGAIARGYWAADAGEFERTPKRVPRGLRLDAYVVERDWTVWAEGLAAFYCFGSFGLIAASGRLLWAFPMLLWAASFAFVWFQQNYDPAAEPEPALSPSASL